MQETALLVSALRNKPCPNIGPTDPAAKLKTLRYPDSLISSSNFLSPSLTVTPQGPSSWKWPEMSSDGDSLLSSANTNRCPSTRSNDYPCRKPSNGNGSIDSSLNNQCHLSITSRAGLRIDAGCVSSQWRSPECSMHQLDSNNDKNPSTDDCKSDYHTPRVKQGMTKRSELQYLPNETIGALLDYSKTWRKVEHATDSKVCQGLAPEGQSTATRFSPVL